MPTRIWIRLGMAIEIHCLVNGEWRRRNIVGTYLEREDAIGVAQVFVQRWRSYEAVCCERFSTLRLFDPVENREIDSFDEVCSNIRAVTLALGK